MTTSNPADIARDHFDDDRPLWYGVFVAEGQESTSMLSAATDEAAGLSPSHDISDLSKISFWYEGITFEVLRVDEDGQPVGEVVARFRDGQELP